MNPVRLILNTYQILFHTISHSKLFSGVVVLILILPSSAVFLEAYAKSYGSCSWWLKRRRKWYPRELSFVI